MRSEQNDVNTSKSYLNENIVLNQHIFGIKMITIKDLPNYNYILQPFTALSDQKRHFTNQS